VEWQWQGKTEELGESPVPVPLCPPKSCPSATLSTKVLSQCHFVHQSPIPVPLSPPKSCPSATLSTKVLSQWHFVHQSPVPVPLCPPKTHMDWPRHEPSMTLQIIHKKYHLKYWRRGAMSWSAVQEVLYFYNLAHNSKVHYRGHKSPPLDPTVINPVHVFGPCYYFHSSMSRSYKWSLYDFKFSRRRVWRWLSSVMLRRVVW
jgi:hypothetical protein